MKTSTIAKRSCLAVAITAVSFQLTAATRLENPETSQPLGTLAPLVLSDTNLQNPNVKGYRPWFENGSWQGDLGEYSVGADGSLTSSVDYSGVTPKNPGVDPANWSALVQFKANEEAAADYWKEGREIITWVGSSQAAFTWSGIGADNRNLVDAPHADDDDSNILRYIRGERTHEFPDGDQLRARISVLGDIINSKPVYVGAPDDDLTENGYGAWAVTKKDREPRVFVGANDGMLHAFDAETGNEAYAYIPSVVMPKLRNLADVPHKHTYFVDGQLTVRDAFFGPSGKATENGAKWHSVLTGALGAGGKGLFALDITDPDLNDEAATSGTDIKVMWEYGAAANSDEDMGYSYPKPVIAKFNDGNWYVVTGNGYSSGNGKAYLYILNIRTGAEVAKIPVGNANAASPNGLSSPALLDRNRDGKIDVGYAGDIDGDLWKFDFSDTDPDNWDVAYNGKPVFNGLATQPITVAPQISPHPLGGYMLFFATGKLLSQEDLSNDDAQAMYGIRDNGATPRDSARLHVQVPTGSKTYTALPDIEEFVGLYDPDAGDVDWTTKDGWKVPFPAGYRATRPVQVRGDRVKATVYNPQEGVQENWMVEAALADGGPHPTPIFDLNGDTILDDADLFDVSADGDTASFKIPMIWRQADGVMSEVTIARISNGIDTLFLNYLVPPLDIAEPCEIDCGGFQGGHIDVDTWHISEEYGGKSTEHTHEYDKDIGQVYVDFFNLNVEGVSGHVNLGVASSGIDPDEKFVILVANADFSPGSRMTIGGKDDWHVWEYQTAIHTALRNWDATDSDNVPTWDPDGAGGAAPIPLAFTMNEINAIDGGKIQHSFNDQSILQGGLHPTQTGCVKDSAYDTFDPDDPDLDGRWRNGALTTQLIRVSHFTANPAISEVMIQRPSDLRESITIDGVPWLSKVDFDGNGTAGEVAKYEVIGGLIAPNSASLLWESTLFWHFGELSKEILGVKPCYGEDKWKEAAALEQANDPVGALLESLAEDYPDFDFGDSLAQAIDNALECIALEGGEVIDDPDPVDDKDAKDKDPGPDKDLTPCQIILALLYQLEELAEEYEIIENDGTGGQPPGDANPVVVGGGSVERGRTAGPKFNYGRMSWTDVVE